MKNQRLRRLMAGIFAFTVATTSMFSANFSFALAEEDNYDIDLSQVYTTGTGQERLTDVLHSKMRKVNEPEYKPDEEVDIIVEFEDKPLLDYYIEDKTEDDAQSFIKSAKGKQINDDIIERQGSVKEIILDSTSAILECEYSVIMNGIAVKAKYSELEEIKDIEGVKDAFVSTTYELPKLEERTVYEPRMHHSGETIKSKEANNTGYTGKKMAVAVIDSGLDVNHEAFNTAPEDSKYDKENIVHIMSENEMTANGDVYKSEKVPFAYDYADKDDDVADPNGHGTHVSGIIAGNSEELKGVAPDAQLMFMKVFSDEDNGASDYDIISALQDAVVLGADTINMSVGTEGGFTEEGKKVIDETYNRVAASGINLLCAAGNAYSSTHKSPLGELPLVTNPDTGLIDSPATYKAATAVASVNNICKTARYFQAGEEKIVYADSNEGTNADFITLVGEEKEYVVVPNLGNVEDYKDIDVKGKIALVKRGVVAFPNKEANALAAGAIGVIVYDNVEGNLIGMETNRKIPMIFISKEDGEKLVNAKKKIITVLKEEGEFDIIGSDEMSDFSSWGVSPDLKLKPEITAPGGEIYSTLPGGLYGSKSGTSMSSPHMAGAAAVVKQYINENEKFKDLKSLDREYLAMQLLMSTANKKIDPNKVAYSPRKQGAGIANVFNAVKTGAYLIGKDEDGKPKAELGDSVEGEFTFDFDIKNISDKELTYGINTTVLTEKIVENQGNKFFAQASQGLDESQVEVKINDGSKEVVVSPGERNTIKVSLKVTPALKEMLKDCENGTFIDGFVTLVSKNEDKIDLNLPFVGFYGQWNKVPVFDKTIFDKESVAIFPTSLACTNYDMQNMYPLGVNLFAQEDFSLASRDKIAVGENVAKSYAVQGVVGLLRHINGVNYSVMDSSGKSIVKNKGQKHSKSIYDEKSGIISCIMDEKGWLNSNSKTKQAYDEGTYTYKISGLPVGTTEAERQEIEFPVTVDNQIPELVDARVIENGNKRYLELTTTDNHYLQGLQLVNEKDEPISDVIILDANEKGARYKTVFELNDDETISPRVVVIDYALNMLISEPISLAKGEIEPTHVVIKTKNSILPTESEFQMKAGITPFNASNKTLTWTSSNEEVATIDNSGIIKAIAPGETTIMVSTANGKTDSTIINLLDKNEMPVELTKPYTIRKSGNYIIPQNLNESTITIGEDAENVTLVGHRRRTAETPYEDIDVICEGNINLTLNNFNTSITARGKRAITFEGEKNSLILQSENHVTSTLEYTDNALINVLEGQELNISGSGTLDAIAPKGNYAACIGGENMTNRRDSGTINILGGNINVITRGAGAAIGGGNQGIASNINISGGKVMADSQANLYHTTATIGSGNRADNKDKKPGIITIAGGEVTAMNKGAGATIGDCGLGNTDYNISITDGIVNAQSLNDGEPTGADKEHPINLGSGAAIGAGAKSTGNVVIDIKGGIINANTISKGAAIGGGTDSEAGTINIEGGTVTANATNEGAAMGNGVTGKKQNITILKGTVKATATGEGLAIGKGKDGEECTLKGKDDKTPYLVNLPCANVTNVKVDGEDWNITKGHEDDENIYLYLVSKEDNYRVEVASEDVGIIYLVKVGEDGEVTYAEEDLIPPAMPIISEEDGIVTVTAADEDTKVIEYSVDGEKWIEYKEPVKIKENTTIYVRAKDASGNISTVLCYIVPEHKEDEVVPAAPILSEKNGIITLTVIDEEIDKIEYSFDKEKWTEYEKPVVVESGKTIYARAINDKGVLSGIVAYRVPDKIVVGDISTIAGKDRYETAVKVSKEGWENSQIAILANGNAFADALVAAPLASQCDAPILLTESSKLTKVTLEELTRLQVKTVYIVGGESVVSKGVAGELEAKNIEVIRLSGETRYDTSLEVAKYLVGEEKVDHIYVTGGNAPADALTIAPKAAAEETPIILVKTSSIPNDIVDWIKSENLKSAYVIGGESVVDNTVFAKLNEITIEDIKENRISGSNRYATNAEVLDKFYDRKQECIYVTESIKLVDSLVVAPLAGKTNSPVVIVKDELTKEQQGVVDFMSSKKVVKVGGQVDEGAVGELVERLNK